MPGNLMAPSLAESWTVSADQKSYEFKLREGLKFHNGDPFTADDVKFSFHRAKGSKTLHDRVKDVQIVSPTRVRFVLHEPWPDFMAFYGTMVSGAGWIVPKKYVEKVGDDGFKRAPVGLGPYKFVSHQPGIELVMEANESYWRKMPSVKRLVFKSVPESNTRLAMLKRGEVDVAYLLEVPQAQEVKKDPNLKLAFSGGIAIWFLDFLEQWDPKSPWADRRVRLAANYAIDRQALSDAETLGASKPAGNHVPPTFEFALKLEPVSVRPARAKKLLAEAGYPNGFDAGELHQLPPYFSLGEAIVGYFQAVGIRTKMRPMERAAYLALIASKKAKGVCVCTSSLYGNAASRMSEVIPERRRVRLRRLPRHRRALQAAGHGDGQEEARSDAAQDPAARVRARPLRADLRIHLAERHRAARRRARADADQSLSVVGAARRGPAQEAVSARLISVSAQRIASFGLAALVTTFANMLGMM